MTRILLSGVFVAAIVAIGREAPEEMQVERIQQGLVARDPFHNGAGVDVILGRLYYPQYNRYMTALLYKSKSWAGWDKCTQSGPNWVGCEQTVSSCL